MKRCYLYIVNTARSLRRRATAEAVMGLVLRAVVNEVTAALLDVLLHQ
ncbi:hypothetical protein OH807_00015 [Kitasatospora sp. NBC_01560]